MIEALVELPALVGGALSMVAALVVGLAVYFGTRLVVGGSFEPHVRQLATNIFTVIATLVSLMLSLTFADLRTEISEVRQSAESESALIGDLHYDLSRFDPQATVELRQQLLDYVSAVVDEEWPALAKGRASKNVELMFRELENGVLLLEATTPLQQQLRTRSLADLDQIVTYRAERLASSLTATPVFLLVAVVGFIWSSALLSVHEPGSKAIVFIGGYFLFFGLVTYLMVALSNFFTGFAAVSPYPFELLLEWENRS